VAGYSGDASDAMVPPYSYHVADGMMFSTPDSDNDGFPGGSCAAERSHGWWFNLCTVSSVNFMGNAIWTAGIPLIDVRASHMLVKP